MTVVIHVDRGLHRPYARAYWNSVDRRLRLPHVESEYACGRCPPNYPVPAIRITPELLVTKNKVYFFTMIHDPAKPWFMTAIGQ